MELPLFRSRSPIVLGLDISAASIKLLELSKDGEGYRVESYAIEPLPFDAVQEREIKNIEAVGEAIARAVARSQTKIKKGAIAVTGSSVITKVIPMNASLSESDLLAHIELEAERNIPHPLAEVNLDFQSLGPSSKNPEMQEIFLAASRTEIIDTLVEVLAVGGLQAEVVDIEAYALERAYRLMAPSSLASRDKIVAIVDIGAAMMNFSVLNDTQTIYTREQIFGGNQLSEAIERRYGLTAQEAVLAIKQGGLPEDYVSEVMAPFREGVVQQISRSLQFYSSSSQFPEVSHIVLSGGGAMLSGLVPAIKETLKLSASIANPFARMSIAPTVSVPALNANASGLMVCAGLALRSFP